MVAAPLALPVITYGIFRTNGQGLSGPNRAELEVAKRNQDSKKEAAMTETTLSPLGNVITIDDEWIKSHLDHALLDAEADRLCNAQRYERSGARRDTRAGHWGASCRVRPAKYG